MLTYTEIGRYIAASGSGTDLGKVRIDTGTGLVEVTGTITVGPSRDLWCITPTGSYLKIEEGYALTVIS